MAAYAFARLSFPGRDKLFFLFLTAMMIPPIFTLIPNFVLIKNLGWLNTYAGIVAPFFLMTPFAVFFLRQFFLGISKEVEEAALLDGAGRWKIFRQLILPMIGRAAGDARGADLHHGLARVHVAAGRRRLGERARAHRGAERVQVLHADHRAAVGAADGRHASWPVLPLIVLFMAMARRMVDAIGFSGIK